MDFLEFEINEIDEAELIDGEDVGLEEEQKIIANSSKVLQVLNYVNDAVCESENCAASLISLAAKELSKVSDINDKTKLLYDCIMDMDAICQDFQSEISSYISSVDFNEERINYVYERLDKINKLKMKHGNSISKILEKKEEYQTKLKDYLNYEDALAELNDKIIIATEKLKNASKELSDIRKKVAVKLSKDIVEVLGTLNFNDIQFKVEFDESSSFTAKGTDVAVFMISTNKGEDLKPLSDIASGGELSRIMLGIKTILADVDSVETLIFDEIDTGISGRTAQMVAEKMKIIASNHQVIAITHLPQIAAMSDDHYLILKETIDAVTKTDIKKLDFDESINELARILGGAVITDKVIENAREMKNMALNLKK